MKQFYRNLTGKKLLFRMKMHALFSRIFRWIRSGQSGSGSRKRAVRIIVRAHMAEYAPDCEVISNSFIHERISYS